MNVSPLTYMHGSVPTIDILLVQVIGTYSGTDLNKTEGNWKNSLSLFKQCGELVLHVVSQTLFVRCIQ